MSESDAIVLATALGPIFAVLITLWHQGRKEKRDGQARLFVTLMAGRKALPIPAEWVRGLNLIDVIFADHPKVIAAWKDLYDYFHVRPLDERLVNEKRTTLLSEMAKVLGYRNLQQVNIDRYYFPEAHGDALLRNTEVQNELLRVLKATDRLSSVPKADEGRPAV